MNELLTFTTPLMRQTVGFDRFNDLFESLMKETPGNFENYPPYNIEKTSDDDYRIVMAVAGFKMDDLNIVLHDGELTVSGSMKESSSDDKEKGGAHVLHRGIATRSFERKFQLADYIEVTGAELKDGLLTISLLRKVPEEKKPRMIPIIGNLLEASGKKKH